MTIEVVQHADDARLASQGDLVTFAAGLRCTWDTTRAVRKHDRFG